MGLMSLKASARPLSRNHWNESRWMAIRSGRGSASVMFANETRSGLRDREDNGQLLPGGKRRAGAVLRGRGNCGQGYRKKVDGRVRSAWARAETAELRTRAHGDARQPSILSTGVRDYNPFWRARPSGLRPGSETVCGRRPPSSRMLARL